MWDEFFDWDLRNQRFLFQLDIQWNGSQQLQIVCPSPQSDGQSGGLADSENFNNNSVLPIPHIVYKNVKISLANASCVKMEKNKLILSLYIPNQVPGYWQVRAGQKLETLGVKEFVDLQFNAAGTVISASGSKFQRQYEGGLGLEGRLMNQETVGPPRPVDLRLSASEKSRIEDQGSCPVCFENFENPSESGGVLKCITKNCKHAFCPSCITNVLEAEPPSWQGNCPICRSEVNSIYLS